MSCEITDDITWLSHAPLRMPLTIELACSKKKVMAG